ncbi:MAG: putative 2-dehydropantoate 2-reductase, partial [Cyanobacteria bacterium P01_H01_bin.121]
MTVRQYAIIGAGAVGGFYGACLQQAGHAVHFLLRRDYPHVVTHGLKIESADGDFALPTVNAYAKPEAMPVCDVVIVALKATRNVLLSQLLPPLLGPQTVVLLLQNGLNAEIQIANQFPETQILGGLCFICANKTGPGQIRHLDYKSITIAAYGDAYKPQGVTPAMTAIAEDFQQAGVPIQLAEDLLQARWQKLVWNIPFNGLSVVLDAMTDAMMTNPATRTLATTLMQEVQQGAAACDRNISDAFVQRMLSHTEQMKPYRTSMKLDYDAKRPLEVEAILGEPLRLAQTFGASLPRIEMLYQQL